MPPVEQRERRDLTRDRSPGGQERTRAVTRGQGVLERANLQWAAVAAEIRGVSGRASVQAFLAGQADPAALAEWAKGRLRSQLPLLEQALTGLVRPQHRQLLALQWAPSDFLEQPLDTLSAESTRLRTDGRAVPPPPPPAATTGAAAPGGRASEPGPPEPPLTVARAVTVLDPIAGVDQRGAELWVAAGGIDMTRVGPAARLATGSGGAPGHDERAGQQRSGKTRPGTRARRTGLTPWAHAAALPKGPYVSALYPRLAARRGKTRAIRAVAHSIVVSAGPRLSRHEPDRELGAT
jgi:hypothetical protein